MGDQHIYGNTTGLPSRHHSVPSSLLWEILPQMVSELLLPMITSLERAIDLDHIFNNSR